ncbi:MULTISPECIES: hypothetical protein [Alcanivorax]|uniref:hypothetical protein n=1 Tax=Alcanivorax TaxID=59753 RepID=UPI0025BFBB00|nr:MULTISPECIES: hypothetical protein [Alcanivorax]
MSEENIYKAPGSKIVKDIRVPFAIKLSYLFVGLFVVIGFLWSLLSGMLFFEDEEFEVFLLVIYLVLTLLIGWWLYKPIRDRDPKANTFPIFLMLIVGGLLAYDMYSGEFIFNILGILDTFEFLVLVCLVVTLISSDGRKWCGKESSK